MNVHPAILFAIMGAALVAVGFGQSWSVAFGLVNLCLISSIMALGVNIQWGYAGLFNVGVMGFAALGGVGAMLVSMPMIHEGWSAGGAGVFLALIAVIAAAAVIFLIRSKMAVGRNRTLATVAVVALGYYLARSVFDPATDAIEAINPALAGNLGGLGLPIVFGWVVGGVLAAAAAYVVAKIALGLRSDYLAIATLGISEIIVAMMKNEDWLTRGVKNVNGLPRPVPYEIDLQKADWFLGWADTFGLNGVAASSIFVKLCYAALFALVLFGIMWLSQKALNSPWGRMMRAIRDNEDAAEAMGKDVTGRHLQVFVLGSVVIGIAGAMLTTLDGQFTPASYQPLRFTFLIWVMVIVGGSGNNWGSVFGGFLIWFVWIEAEPAGTWFMSALTSGFGEQNAFRLHMLEAAPHMRMILMGAILLLALRFFPRGLIPERTRM
jgi:branched-chain amino acid transport system permease protein